jgi:hypothetical protein
MKYPGGGLKAILRFSTLTDPGFSLIVWECFQSNEENGRTALEVILESEPPPTAVLATSDRLTIGVMEAARSHQLCVPQDLAVVGFDDIPAAKLITPRLITVHQPMAEKGRRAVSVSLKEKGLLRTRVPTKLILRQSTDPAILRVTWKGDRSNIAVSRVEGFSARTEKISAARGALGQRGQWANIGAYP